MTPSITTPKPRPIVYPETDGLPMAENTVQFNAIVAIKENLEIVFAADPQVFVAGDLFWYPEEGNNKLRVAPDTLVVFGVPKGDRGSYRQWEEKGIAPQVVFEVLSPGNRTAEMSEKFRFYDRFGVEEYYVFNPDDGLWDGWRRLDGQLTQIEAMHNWVSPRMKIRFESSEGSPLTLFRPNGDRFISPQEMDAKRLEAEENANLERLAREQATRRADRATQRADQATQRAEEATRLAESERAAREEAERRSMAAEERAARLEALLKASGIQTQE